jgi:hypothetical protein
LSALLGISSPCSIGYSPPATRGDVIDWEELDLTFEVAVKAVGEDGVKNNISPGTRATHIVVILEGGIVQVVVADRPDTAPAVVEHHVEPTSIDLDEIFRNAGQ